MINYIYLYERDKIKYIVLLYYTFIIINTCTFNIITNTAIRVKNIISSQNNYF